MGVGVGEATSGRPPIPHLPITSRLPNCPSPWAVAAAPFIGQGLANIAGGPLIDYLEATPNYVVPVVVNCSHGK